MEFLNNNVVLGYNLQKVTCDLENKDYNFVGIFSAKTWTNRASIGYVYPLTDEDEDFLSKSFKGSLKDGEIICRYETRIMFGMQRPLIKFNFKLKQPRIYFLDPDENLTETRFETSGVLFHWGHFDLSEETVTNCLLNKY